MALAARAFLSAVSFIIFHETAVASQSPRAYVTGAETYQVSGPVGAQNVEATGGATVAEGIKLLQNECPLVLVNMRGELADYIITVSDDGSGAARKGRRSVVFSKSGDLVSASSARTLKNAIKDSCAAIQKDWATKTSAVNP